MGLFCFVQRGSKKEKNDTQKSKFKDTQGVYYHHYDNENDQLRGAGEGQRPSRGQIIIEPAAYDYAAMMKLWNNDSACSALKEEKMEGT